MIRTGDMCLRMGEGVEGRGGTLNRLYHFPHRKQLPLKFNKRQEEKTGPKDRWRAGGLQANFYIVIIANI
jgi:hypothetical protein